MVSGAFTGNALVAAFLQHNDRAAVILLLIAQVFLFAATCAYVLRSSK
jgi:hypothetical protein